MRGTLLVLALSLVLSAGELPIGRISAVEEGAFTADAAGDEEEQGASARLVSAYGANDRLYTFVSPERISAGGTTMRLFLDSAAEQEHSTPQLLAASGVYSRTLVLIDRSGSMKKYASDVEAFVSALMAADRENGMNAVYTVAGFGDQFQVTGQEDMTDPDAVRQTLDDFYYDENYTNAYAGVVYALQYLNSRPRNPGDVVSLVLLTDGQPTFDPSKGVDAEKAAREAAEAIVAAPEIVVHTLTMEPWAKEAGTALTVGHGMQYAPDEDGKPDAAAAGGEVATFVAGLYLNEFATAGRMDGTFSVRLAYTPPIAEGERHAEEQMTNELAGVRMFRLSAAGTPVKSVGEAEDAPPGEAVKLTDAAPEEAEAAVEITEESAGGEAAGTGEQPTFAARFSENRRLLLLTVIGAVACFVVLLLIVWSAGRRRRRAGGGEYARPAGDAWPAVTAQTGGIPIRIETRAGKLRAENPIFHLRGELLIGSEKDCEIIFAGEEIRPRHARIFQESGALYIEPVDESCGVWLGGMRLYASNKLRSGDEIDIGGAEFVVRF